MATKSAVVERLDAIQVNLTAVLKPLGFRRRGRFFNRETEPGLVQVIGLQAGPHEIGPPLPPSVAHLRPNLYGRFTVNLGVYVDEVQRRDNHPPRKTIADYDCAVRARLGELTDDRDIWWLLTEDLDKVAEDVIAGIVGVALPFLDRFSTRAALIGRWIGYNEHERRLSNVARLDIAMIRLARGEVAEAAQLFRDQIASSHLPGHQRYVRDKAVSLGLAL